MRSISSQSSRPVYGGSRALVPASARIGLATSGLLFALLSSTSSYAACSDNMPSGVSTVVCSGTDNIGITVSGLDDDKKTVEVATGAIVNGNVQFADGNDWLTNNGTINGAIVLGDAPMNTVDRVVNNGTLGDGSVGAINGNDGRQEVENNGTH